MKTLLFIFALILLNPLIGLSQDEQIKALYERAAPKYREEYNKLVESGSLEPKEAEMQGKEGSLQRKLWLAGYYAAIMEYIEPDTVIETTEFDRSGKIHPHGYGVKKAYAFGYWNGVLKADPVARKLHVSIVAQLLQDDEAEAARKKDTAPKK